MSDNKHIENISINRGPYRVEWEPVEFPYQTGEKIAESINTFQDNLLGDALKFTTIPSKFINGHFNCDDLSVCGTDPAAGRDWSASNIIDSVRKIRGLMPRPIKLDYGKIIVNQSLCMKTFIRFSRNHRKARINKKWHKKYGAITRCVANPVEIKGMGFFMCPCRERELKESIKNPMLPTV